VIRGPRELVWRAHHQPDLLQRWLLGPDGWTMPVCAVATKVGDHCRPEWEQAGGAEWFGFKGELLGVDPPHRAVTTERMIGMDGPGTVNRMTLTPVGAGTLLTIVVTYPDAEPRDQVLGTGMMGGMEQRYARLGVRAADRDGVPAPAGAPRPRVRPLPAPSGTSCPPTRPSGVRPSGRTAGPGASDNNLTASSP
jgi:uncharacterized protein YndB with AHSA1/START domain